MPYLRSIEVVCPYCGHQFSVEKPTAGRGSIAARKPFEVECVAYTRDIGRFDPQSEADWFSSKGWSRIGKDYLSLISYEKVGILRVRHTGIDVRYRVQVCEACHELFDVYANYTLIDHKRVYLHKLWPHVFGRKNRESREIDVYHGESIPLWSIRKLGSLFGNSKTMGAIALGLLLFGLSLLPWLFHPGLDQGAFLIEAILHFVAAFSVTAILLISTYYANYLKTTSELGDSLIVKEKRSLVHWRNYTLCRMMGVQQGAGAPKPSQVDIIAGTASVVTLVFSWAAVRHDWLALAIGLLILGLSVSAFLDFRRRFSPRLLRWVSLLVPLGTLLLVGILWLSGALHITWEACHQGVVLLFWIVAAYLLGTGTLLTESMANYVLVTLSRIPMRLSPYNQFSQIKPLRRIQAYSTWVILLLFVTILLVLAVIFTFKNLPAFSQAAAQWDWLVIWMCMALALIFGGLGLGGKKPVFLVIFAIYVTLFLLSQSWNPVINVPAITLGFFDPQKVLPAFSITIQSSLLVVGLFLTFLLAQHMIATEHIISNLINATRAKFLKTIDAQIERVNAAMATLDQPDDGPATGSGYEASLQNQVEVLSNLLELRAEVAASQNRPRFRVVQLISPLISSFVFPFLVENVLLPIVETTTHLKLT